MSENNSNNDNQKELMNMILVVIAMIVLGYFLPIVLFAMMRLFLGCFEIILYVLVFGEIGTLWDEIVEGMMVFAELGKLFAPITAILFPLVGIFSQKKE